MAIIELSTALVAAGSGLVVPFVNKVLEKSAQRIGGQVDEHLAVLFTRAHDYLAATGREAQSVEPKLLKAVVENAPYETDPVLAEKWAALLANAADSAQRATVQLGFADALRQLTPMEARLLAFIYRNISPDVEADETLKRVEDDASTKVDLARPLLKISAIELQGAIDNLLRLRLCKVPEGALGGNELLHETFLPVYRVAPTVFGYQFMNAVTPPTI